MGKKAFTLIELLVALAIIGLLAGSISVTFTSAGKKAQDAIVKQNLSSIRSSAEEVYFTTYPNTYLPVCFDSIVDLILRDLGDAAEIEEQDYQCLSSTERWLAIFPLKQGGYWCSDGLGRSMYVDGFVEYSSPEYMDCTLAVSPDPDPDPPPPNTGGGGSTATPAIFLQGDLFIDLYSKSGNPFRGGAWHKFHEPGYTAVDAQDGDVTENVIVEGPILISTGGPKSCRQKVYEIKYTVLNSGNIASSVSTRTVTHHKCKAP